jgi:hypothetical protein
MTSTTPATPERPVTGKSLVRAAWSTLRSDLELLLVPIVGAFAAMGAVVPFGLVYLFIPDAAGAATWVVGALALFATTFVTTLFAVAFAAGANERMDGGDPTVRSSLAAAWQRRRAVAQWAALATVVGLILRAIEQRFPVSGKFISALGGLTWAVASYFAIPVLATDDVSGWEAVKRSSATLVQRFGKVVRVQIRLLLLQLAVIAVVAALVVVGVMLLQVSVVAATGVFAAALISLVVASMVLNAITALARLALYRYATGLPVPGFDTAALERAVVTKR